MSRPFSGPVFFLLYPFIVSYPSPSSLCRCSFHFPKVTLSRVTSFLSSVSPGERLYLRRHLRHFFQTYMSSVRKIAMTTLHILNDRAVRHAARTHSEWNDPPGVRRQVSSHEERTIFSGYFSNASPALPVLSFPGALFNVYGRGCVACRVNRREAKRYCSAQRAITLVLVAVQR